MRSSLRKLRGLAMLHRGEEPKEVGKKGEFCYRPLYAGELAQASQDIKDIRSCYDDFISAAAAAANSIYEFSEALKEMGTCLLEKTVLNDDEESAGEVLSMLGKAQFKLQKLANNYRASIIETVASPSECLLSELQMVEEKKQQCEAKREVFENLFSAKRGKGISKNHKRQFFTSQQLQIAQEEYHQEVTQFISCLKSLKQGQSENLLTQSARHYAAQLTFFQKAGKSLESIEPCIQMAGERHHIDYQCNVIEDSELDDYNNVYDCCSSEESGMSFDYDRKGSQKIMSTFRNQVVGNQDKDWDSLLTFNGRPRPGSQSTPIFQDRKYPPSEKVTQLHHAPTRRSDTYALPTPVENKRTESAYSDTIPIKQVESSTEHPTQLWHSSPLASGENMKIPKDDRLSVLAQSINGQSALRDINTNYESTRLLSSSEEPSLPLSNPRFSFDNEKIKRQAFSGPLMSKARSRKSVFSPIVEHPPAHFTTPMPQSYVSPKVSSNLSRPLSSSPKISELHELPRPPTQSSVQPTRSASLIGHSAPLASRCPKHLVTSKKGPMSSCMPSPLQTSATTTTRTFSVANDQRISSILQHNLMEAYGLDAVKQIDSPPLTPIVLADPRRVSNAFWSET